MKRINRTVLVMIFNFNLIEMKPILIILTISFYTVSCCPTQVYPVPDKLKYNQTLDGKIETFVVNNSVYDGYVHLNTTTFNTKTLYSYYHDYFENERIQTIDFQDSLKADVAFYSNGKIIKTIHTHFTPTFEGEVDLIGTLNNDYVALLTSPSYGEISFYMNSYKRKGEVKLTNNLVATSLYSNSFNLQRTRNKLIELASLSNGDTIYSSLVNLEYLSY